MAKTDQTENFPVASFILAPHVRAEILDFYKKARRYDDIADSPTLSVQEKQVALADQADSPFLNDLLIAFRQDAVKDRYETWDQLLEYCRYSANPVGRFLLQCHGESGQETASDALCTALQILNHLQDCQKDFHTLNRIYLPQDYLAAPLTYEDELNAPHCSKALRAVLDRCLDHCDQLIHQARPLIAAIKNKRLRYQAKVTLLCAIALAGKLRRQDPLARRVELSTLDKLLLAYKGFYPL